jgi:hypothetical protein
MNGSHNERLIHAILAGGRSTRLYGDAGGCKAIESLSADQVLVDYCLDEACVLSPTRVVVSTSFECEDLLRAHLKFKGLDAEFIVDEPRGTGHAVSRLLSNCVADFIFLTTCDIAGPSGHLSSFLQMATESLEGFESEPMCIIAISNLSPDESSPIFVHLEVDGNTVTGYGKDQRASPLVFGSARVLNLAFATLYRQMWRAGMTDTETMAAMLQSNRGCIKGALVPEIFDVDDATALAKAVKTNR